MGVEQSLKAFVAAAALVTITPGLDTALVLRAAAAGGRRSAILAGLGICLGCLAWGLIVAVGLGALLAASQFAYTALKVVGAAYLLYLGAVLLLQRADPSKMDAAKNARGGHTWFRRGLLTNLLNPKVGVFYTAFLPQFVPTDVNVTTFTMLLALIHATLGLGWFLVLARFVGSASQIVRDPRISVWLDRALGGLMVLIGGRLLTTVRE